MDHLTPHFLGAVVFGLLATTWLAKMGVGGGEVAPSF